MSIILGVYFPGPLRPVDYWPRPGRVPSGCLGMLVHLGLPLPFKHNAGRVQQPAAPAAPELAGVCKDGPGKGPGAQPPTGAMAWSTIWTARLEWRHWQSSRQPKGRGGLCRALFKLQPPLGDQSQLE